MQEPTLPTLEDLKLPDLLARIVLPVLLAIALMVEAVLHLSYLPHLGDVNIANIGGWSEVLIWTFLAVLFVGIQLRPIPAGTHLLLTLGLGFWLISATADLMDEVVLQPLWVSAWVEDLARVIGMVLVTLGLLSLVRHTSAMISQLQRLSLREPLTGLGNRRLFDREMMSRSSRDFSLLMIDLDHFKKVNDTHGHDVGDQVLVRVSRGLNAVCPDPGSVYRLGGEEFAMVCESMSPTRLKALAQMVCDHIAKLEMPKDLKVTASVGAASLQPGESPFELARRADQALYSAKEAGRNRVELAMP
ncbi:MAG: GGDEF domain-containing protein [Wenzhouxiangellaceae bacterium]|nr:GGDEF domain-containing protein [Wenzhouxiangellaceae bacterium]